MVDSRHDFAWKREHEPSWVQHLESLRLTPPARDVRARFVSARAIRELPETPAFYPSASRDHRGPLDPFGHDD